ncbi:MAG: nucleoside hydrolase [Clostridia bacterium]|nr:nucleoside hydrolase [Clostridia bacterium]MBQ3077969.1 nucleoside hydrolase [Clostridia bacterium]
MSKRKIILDVDTGSDDALAIMTALLAPEHFEVVGICSVHGNRPIENTTENTLRVVELLGSEVPVIRGCAAPLTAQIDPLRALRIRANQKELEDGEQVQYHAEQLPLPPATRTPLPGAYASIWYIETLMAAKEKITLVMVGPQTNFALAYRIEPRILEQVEEIVIMGGGHDQHNSTGAAEFNIFADPEAAAIVFECGEKVPLTVLPLDATHLANMRPHHEALFRSWGTAVGDFVADQIRERLDAYNVMQPLHEPDIAPIHDALCLIYLMDESVITKKKFVRADVVCGGMADGDTLFDTRYYTDRPKNCTVCLSTDEEKFAALFVEVLSRAR